ncbi:MAG: DUF2975 domain-containing protein [Alphaproteobacteria bacterium]|nr:DUF2975 domain-containing protein [Alphaproteobacteria bacterium]NCQ67277.1 DUF2975 domain-containing protein [Alphaproteobacteria bacterium]NCT06756.1 DUF2975 domain-containing protein [Alphaproteobacteria bacterium]
MTNIKKISRALQWIFGLYLISSPLASLFFWVLSTFVPLKQTFMGNLFDQGMFEITVRALGKSYSLYGQDFSWNARFLGLLGDFAHDIFKWIAAFYVICLMKLYATGNLFSQKHAFYFKRIGQSLLFYGTFGLVAGDSILGIAVTFDNPVGQRLLSIGFGTPNVEMIVVSLMIILVGWVMLEGFKLRAEQELTI